jgi:peptidoglycan/LPS O-acetylase OafA/YrhL
MQSSDESQTVNRPRKRVNSTYKKIDALTSLRFIAVAMIVVHHSRGVLWLTPDFLNHFALDQAVSFFFVLSGFVLTYVYPRLIGPSPIKKFYIARFARIWPIHVVAFAALFMMFLPWSYYNIIQPRNTLLAIANLLLLHGWYPAMEIFFSFNQVTWAVSTEVFFYLTFPLLIRDFEKTWIPKLLMSLLIMLAIVMFCNFMELPFALDVPFNVISRTGFVYINPLSRLFEFVTGMCVAVIWKKYEGRIRLGKNVGTLLEVIVVCVVIATVYISISVNSIIHLIGPAGTEYLSHAGSCLSFALLVFTIAMRMGHISRLLSSKIFVVLGEASYSVFLFHQLILRFYTAHHGYFSTLPGAILYVLFWIVTLLISFLVLIQIGRAHV